MAKWEPSHLVAQRALEKLLSKIPEMVQNYSQAMQRFASDAEAQRRYVEGVAAWIEAMRDPAVREAVYRAIATAKAKYYQKRAVHVAPAKEAVAVARA